MDIILVTFNSQKWIKNCFGKLSKSDFDLTKVNIYIFDNHSIDSTLEELYNVKDKYEKNFGLFEIFESDENLGFGKANNIAFSKGKSDIVLFLNIDTEIYPNALKNLEYEIEHSNKDVVIWELRQFPYEHPKIYNPITMETTWCSGAAFAIRRDAFSFIGGFEEKIFMYAEDVDLSWRLRSYGYKLHYCPRVMVNHYSYENVGEIKPTQYIYSILNNLLLRCRYGGNRAVLSWCKMIFRIMRQPNAFWGAKKCLLKNILLKWKDILWFKLNKRKGNIISDVPKFIGFDYETIREGAFYKSFLPKSQPLVSIIVRTCGRPTVLRETLISLRNQTYSNIEIVIVEDGAAMAQSMIMSEFEDLSVVYYATQEKVGRSKAGNIAMKMAKGEYLNFLDDDDLFYADHVETLVANLENTQYKAAYSLGFEIPVEILSIDPYVYKVISYNGIHKQGFNKMILAHHNYIPIQCIMFKKELFLLYGGLDESLDALEDWDLWVRYSLYTDFKFVSKTTSLYKVPYEREDNRERQQVLDETLKIVREKHKKYIQKVSIYELAMGCEGLYYEQ